MATIGRDDISGMVAVAQSTTTTLRMNLDTAAHTAAEGETATVAGVYVASEYDGETVDVYLYDITGLLSTNPEGAPLIGSYSITLGAGTGRHTVAISQALTAGRQYAVATGAPSASIQMYRETGLASGSGSTGPSPPAPDPWSGSAANVQYAAFITTEVAPTFGITDVNGDDTIVNGSSITINHTNASGTGHVVTIGGVDVSATIISQSATQTVLSAFNIANWILTYGSATLTLIDGENSANRATTIEPATGYNSVLLGTLAESGNRLTALPDDLAPGDTVEWGNVQGGIITDVTVEDDASIVRSAGVTKFDARAFTPGEGWGAFATQTTEALNSISGPVAIHDHEALDAVLAEADIAGPVASHPHEADQGSTWSASIVGAVADHAHISLTGELGLTSIAGLFANHRHAAVAGVIHLADLTGPTATQPHQAIVGAITQASDVSGPVVTHAHQAISGNLGAGEFGGATAVQKHGAIPGEVFRAPIEATTATHSHQVEPGNVLSNLEGATVLHFHRVATGTVYPSGPINTRRLVRIAA